jgi:GNAT superfamily N-acetyltransferase
MDYDISFDPDRVQLEIVHGFLSSAYWSPNIRRDVIENAIRHSLVVSAFARDSGRQIGFARAVTDYATFAWLCDVFVDEAHRGHGIAKRMVGDLLSHHRLQTLRRWALATKDAHALYLQLGFEPVPMERWMEFKRPMDSWKRPG